MHKSTKDILTLIKSLDNPIGFDDLYLKLKKEYSHEWIKSRLKSKLCLMAKNGLIAQSEDGLYRFKEVPANKLSADDIVSILNDLGEEVNTDVILIALYKKTGVVHSRTKLMNKLSKMCRDSIINNVRRTYSINEKSL